MRHLPVDSESKPTALSLQDSSIGSIRHDTANDALYRPNTTRSTYCSIGTKTLSTPPITPHPQHDQQHSTRCPTPPTTRFAACGISLVCQLSFQVRLSCGSSPWTIISAGTDLQSAMQRAYATHGDTVTTIVRPNHSATSTCIPSRRRLPSRRACRIVCNDSATVRKPDEGHVRIVE